MNDIEKLNYVLEFQKKNPYYPDAFIKFIAKNIYMMQIRLEHPLMMTWDLMNSCNLSCSFCSASSSRYKGKSIKLVDWERAINFIVSCNPIYLTLRGGEPSIHPHFEEILKQLSVWNGYLEIVSNGTGFSDEVVEILKIFHKDRLRVKISLDSSNEEINDANRSKQSYFYALRAIANLSKANIKNLRVQAVATQRTIPGIFELYQFLHNYKVNSFGVSYCIPSGDARDNRHNMFSGLLLDQFIQCINLYYSKKQIRLEKNHLGYWQNVTDHISILEKSFIDSELEYRVKCGAGRWKLNIDANGDIYPCDFLKYSNFKLGTINDSVEKIWNHSTLKMLNDLKRTDKRECATCNNKLCNTGCMGLAFERYRDILRKDPNCLMGNET